MKFTRMTVAQVQHHVQVGFKWSPVHQQALRSFISMEGGEPYKLQYLIEWVKRLVVRGRLPNIKVTPSRNKREGRYCGNHPTLFANPRHQRMGRREYYDVFLDAPVNARGHAALRK